MHLSPLWAALLVLGPLVLLHELGHYSVARWVGVRVLAFSIGLGPVLLKWRSRSGTEWRLSLIPLGGYVKMLDEAEGVVAHEDMSKAFNRRPLLARTAVSIAGPLVNILLAWVIYSVLSMQGGYQLKTLIGRIEPNSPAAIAGMHTGEQVMAIDGHAVNSWEGINLRMARRVGDSGDVLVEAQYLGQLHSYHLPIKHFLAQGDDAIKALGWVPPEPPIAPVIGSLEPLGPAQRAGLKVGDLMLSMNGHALATWPAWVDAIEASPDQDMEITVQRQGIPLLVKLHSETVKDDMGLPIGRIGAAVHIDKNFIWPPASLLTYVQEDFWGGWIAGAKRLSSVLGVTLDTVAKLFTGHLSLEHLSGPIGIAHVASASAAYGWAALFSLGAMLSVSLGVLNLLPIPVLDGGHVLYFMIEAVWGRPLPVKIQNWGVALGAALMMAIMIFVIANDVRHFY